MCFIVGLGRYDPREGKGLQLVSVGFVLEIMCSQGSGRLGYVMSNLSSAQINHIVIPTVF